MSTTVKLLPNFVTLILQAHKISQDSLFQNDLDLDIEFNKRK